MGNLRAENPIRLQTEAQSKRPNANDLTTPVFRENREENIGIRHLEINISFDAYKEDKVRKETRLDEKMWI